MKIGQYLAKIWTRVRVLLFLRHGVESFHIELIVGKSESVLVTNRNVGKLC